MKTPAAKAVAAAKPPPFPVGEFGFNRDDFQFIANTLHEDAGIHLPASKASLVYSRLTKRLRMLGLESFRDYCALVGSADGADERSQMISALTTNVTRFFREPHHFDHLKARLIEPLADEVRAGRRIRIWSAGCSSGQEPYSIALSILSHLPDARSFDVRILASDINPHVLQAARRAVYSAEEASSVPPELRRAWTEPLDDGSLRLDEAARGLVTFRPLNLIGAWPMGGAFDAVFCRNVAIYFDKDTQARLWNRFANMLSAEGHLFIGHSERLNGPAEQRFRSVGVTAYARIGPANPQTTRA